jgi:acyl-CoA oxidase
VSEAGEWRQVGDPRVGYGTMMYIREIISNLCPKQYAMAIIVATRYSFYRRQGLGHQRQEINVLEYQTQQEKVLPRIAEYYALTLAGAEIGRVSQENRERVLRNDFSLLQETHSCLAVSKCLFSEVCQDGIEVLRRSMGGHGTSYYSGLPQLLNEYVAHNTHEG